MSRRDHGFGTQGYGLLPRLLEPGLVEALRREVDARVCDPPPAGCERPHNSLFPLRWNDPLVRLVLDGGVCRCSLVQLIAPRDLRRILAYLRTIEPRTPPLLLHQD